MSTTETKKDAEAREAEAIVKGAGGLPVGHPHASYVGPDLSFTDGVGELPDDLQKEADERDKEHEEQVTAAVANEKKVAELRREADEEAAELALEARDAQVKKQVELGQVAAPTPTSEQLLAEKVGGAKGGKRSS